MSPETAITSSRSSIGLRDAVGTALSGPAGSAVGVITRAPTATWEREIAAVAEQHPHAIWPAQAPAPWPTSTVPSAPPATTD